MQRKNDNIYQLISLYKTIVMLILCFKKDHVLGNTKRDEILVLVWILKIASAKIGANDNLFTFPSVFSSYFSFAGIEFVTITWSS